MQAYDILLLIVLAIATLFGMIKGFAWQVASVASILISYFVAYNFRGQVASKIAAEAPWNLFLAMLLLFGGTSFVIWVIFRMVSTSIDRVRLRDFDRQMGALLGFGKGVLYCVLITMFAMTLLGERQQQAIVGSKGGHYISRLLAAAEGVAFPHEIDAVIRPHLDRVRQRLDQPQTAAAGTPGTFGLPGEGSSGNAWGFPTGAAAQPPAGLPTSTPANGWNLQNLDPRNIDFENVDPRAFDPRTNPQLLDGAMQTLQNAIGNGLNAGNSAAPNAQPPSGYSTGQPATGYGQNPVLPPRY